MKFLVPFVFLVFVGCASVVQQWIPGVEPVTAERCEKLDLKGMGYKDGEIGQRPGDRYDFWMKDCRSVGVRLNRDLYDEGFAEGLKVYCSCEKGFNAGVRDEFTEMQGQYYSCVKKEFAVFLQGHAAGKKYSQDPRFMKKDGPYKTTYFDEPIQAKAKEECDQIRAGGGPVPTVPSTPNSPASQPSNSSNQDPPKN
jgi:hypothetical protein